MKLSDVPLTEYSREEGLIAPDFEGLPLHLPRRCLMAFLGEKRIARRRPNGVGLRSSRLFVPVGSEIIQAPLVNISRHVIQTKSIGHIVRLAEIRAPIFEEKVVDHIVAQANVTDKKVTREELFKVEDAEDGAAATA